MAIAVGLAHGRDRDVTVYVVAQLIPSPLAGEGGAAQCWDGEGREASARCHKGIPCLVLTSVDS
jgi:hypothetical protein